MLILENSYGDTETSSLIGKRLSEKRPIKPTTEEHEDVSAESSRIQRRISNAQIERTRTESSASRPPLVDLSLEQTTTLSPIAECQFLTSPWVTVSAALFRNGQILGIPCSLSLCSTSSPPAGVIIPLALQPTVIQLTMTHALFIDRFPFPSMRDNMIALAGLLDYEEFLQDILLMQSFSIVPGRESWDPPDWRIGGQFRAKWGYLFC